MFESARLKIARADHHVADLKRQFEAFVKRKPHRFSIKHDQNTGQPVIQIRFVEAVPYTFSVIIGDAVHNLRCALDHIMWELIGWDGGTQNKHLKFPCYERKIDFEAACKGIQTPSEWIKAMLMGMECYVRGGGEMLYVMHTLDNTDKHRVITPVLRATMHPAFQIYYADGKPFLRMVGNKLVGGLGDTMHIAQVPPGGYVELDDDAQCAPSIFIAEAARGDAFQALAVLSSAVKGALARVESEIAKHPKT